MSTVHVWMHLVLMSVVLLGAWCPCHLYGHSKGLPIALVKRAASCFTVSTLYGLVYVRTLVLIDVGVCPVSVAEGITIGHGLYIYTTPCGGGPGG